MAGDELAKTLFTFAYQADTKTRRILPRIFPHTPPRVVIRSRIRDEFWMHLRTTNLLDTSLHSLPQKPGLLA